MPIATIDLYNIVLFVHILAVVVGFGVVFTYPLLDAYARRSRVADLVALHRFQSFLTQRLIQPALLVILVAGIYLATDRWKLSDPWISATFAILIVIGAIAGAIIGPTEKRCLALAQRDLGGGGKPSDEYEGQAIKLARFGGLASLLITVAIFLMVTKPGA
ncbi:MAG: hypothetical protein QOE11_3380 [Solirubrobacteraceae bacterium]|jgi:uncharacterized membrane protein|nr:hypothetical protein [Solirubrobacteraceae bacterium]